MVTEVSTKKIDADTHFNMTVDYSRLRDMLPRGRNAELAEIMSRDTMRMMDPDSVRAAVAGAPEPGSHDGDPEWDLDARIKEMDRLGFDMQVLNTQRAMPGPQLAAPPPLWLRTALATLYNDEAAAIQKQYPDRFICQITFPWDDIEASVKEVERAAAKGLKAVSICGSYMDQNLDAYELYPFWEAVSGLDLACIVHNYTQGHRGNMHDHQTGYPMVGTERFHRMHIGTYLGFGLDYTVACAALTLGGVLEQFPKLRFLFFEAGATWMAYAMHGADRSFYIERACSRSDTLPSELILQHCYTAVENIEPLKQLVEVYGADNFVIGTDFPHPEFQRLPNASTDILNAKLSAEDKSKILGGNLARALRI
jgi:predicted TIM-barrel fold metal-dependent hydrolase